MSIHTEIRTEIRTVARNWSVAPVVGLLLVVTAAVLAVTTR